MHRPTQVSFERQYNFRIPDCHRLWLTFPSHSASRLFGNSHVKDPTTPPRKTLAVWALPLSLAATYGIDFSFFSTRYLDVSVPWVGYLYLCIQYKLVRVPRDHYLFVSSPKLFADFHALHRLLTPRHPPCALSNLTTEISNSQKPPVTTQAHYRPVSQSSNLRASRNLVVVR